jgi:hypothetical protein
MRLGRRIGLFAIAAGTCLLSHADPALAQAAASPTKDAAMERDGQHDFDFLFGNWKFHLKRLLKPLTGSTSWVKLDGHASCRPIWDGKANIDELVVDNAERKLHIQGLTLRLYNPASHQWSLHWANAATGVLGTPPNVGQFKDDRGEFYDQEEFNGRSIFVRYVWSGITPTSAHFEQSFSTDGGKTWEVNWITDQTREP